MIMLMAFSLGIDAFAVSVSCGMTVSDFRRTRLLWLSVYFGLFQAGMLLLGAFLGGQFSHVVGEAGRFISFLLLAVIGGDMVRGALRGTHDDTPQTLPHRRMFLLAIATSVDAFAAGISLALQAVPIFSAALVIGAVAFGLATLGGLFGQRMGGQLQKGATLAGGFVLIALGLRNLLF